MPKEFYKNFPATTFSVLLVFALFGQSLLVGSDSVITNAVVQAQWCGQGDSICILKVYGIVSLIILFVGILIDWIRSAAKGKEKPEATRVGYEKSPHTERDHIGDIVYGDKVINEPPPVVNPENPDSDIAKILAEKEERYKGYLDYQARDDDTLESISNEIYGNSRFVKYIIEANDGARFPPPRGSHMILPSVLDWELTERPEKQYASIRIRAINSKYPIYCHAFVSKIFGWDKDGGIWKEETEKLMDNERYLSWHQGSPSPEKPIEPDKESMINIIKLNMNSVNCLTSHPRDIDLKYENYKVWIVIKWRRDERYEYYIERVIACIDTKSIFQNTEARYQGHVFELDVKECKNERW